MSAYTTCSAGGSLVGLEAPTRAGRAGRRPDPPVPGAVDDDLQAVEGLRQPVTAVASPWPLPRGPTRSRAGAARAPGRDGSADRGEMRTPPHPVEAGLRPDGVSTAAAVSPLGEVGRPRLPRSWHGHGPGVPSKFALERAGGLMW